MNTPARRLCFLCAALAAIALLETAGCVSRRASHALPAPSAARVVGYWHNWDGTSTDYIPLDEIPAVYNWVHVAFAIPAEPGRGRMVFAPNVVSPEEFGQDLRRLQRRGARVLISIGGGNHPVELKTPADRDAFVRSMRAIIDTWGFDGMDIDLEGVSTVLDPGDSDFRRPTTPKIRYFIQAVRRLVDFYGPEFLLTAAPETQYVTGAYHRYGEHFGGYLPILHALRDRLDLVHMQLYNSGSQYLYTGATGPGADIIAEQGTVDFVVGLTEMMILGFPVERNPRNRFAGFGADRIAVGLPAAPKSAENRGELSNPALRCALTRLLTGTGDCRSTYRMRRPGGHPDLGGVMTWSINWDATQRYRFGRTAAEILRARTAAP